MIGEENKYLDDKYQAIQTKRSIDSDGIWGENNGRIILNA